MDAQSGIETRVLSRVLASIEGGQGITKQLVMLLLA